MSKAEHWRNLKLEFQNYAEELVESFVEGSIEEIKKTILELDNHLGIEVIKKLFPFLKNRNLKKIQKMKLTYVRFWRFRNITWEKFYRRMENLILW